MNATDLLGPVDWSEWRRIADDTPKVAIRQPTIVQPALAHAVVVEGKAHAIGEAERVALLVLALGRQRNENSKAVRKAIRCALRDIEQAVLTAEQDIDYETES